VGRFEISVTDTDAGQPEAGEYQSVDFEVSRSPQSHPDGPAAEAYQTVDAPPAARAYQTTDTPVAPEARAYQTQDDLGPVGYQTVDAAAEARADTGAQEISPLSD
jgi:hypothetical protein